MLAFLWAVSLVCGVAAGWLFRENRVLRGRLQKGYFTGGHIVVCCRVCGRTDLVELKPKNDTREFLSRLLMVTRACREGKHQNLLERD